MRLSTNTIYAQTTQSILNQQSKVARIGQQLASDRRIVTPADDPNGATQALIASHSVRVDTQYASNRDTARQHLSAEENQLDIAVNALGAAKPRLVQAVNGTLSDADRASVATELQGVYDTLLSAANAQDGNGRYIFSGFATDTPPFEPPTGSADGSGNTASPGKVTYTGDTGQRKLAVAGSQQIATNDPGSLVFGSGDNNILNTLAGAISALKTPIAGDAKAAAALTDTLNAANRQLDSSLDNVLTVRATLGTRLKQLDTLDNAGAAQQLADKTHLSNIQDLDQISAISDFSLAKVALQLSEQTFSQVQKLSLFGIT